MSEITESHRRHLDLLDAYEVQRERIEILVDYLDRLTDGAGGAPKRIEGAVAFLAREMSAAQAEIAKIEGAHDE